LTQSIDQGKETIRDLQTSLSATEQAIKNTQPYAYLYFQELVPQGAPGPTPGSINVQFSPAGHIKYNVFWTNSGNDVAKDVVLDARTYVAKPDDVGTQKRLARNFDLWWSKTKHRKSPDSQPREPSLSSFDSQEFTEKEVRDLSDHSETLNILLRWAYSDSTGHWTGDWCISYQDIRQDFRVSHPCAAHNNHRYAN
jgi:hypothetical protein